ncbi:MarR family EPS-associated transcriptional regulator [Desulfoplanes formicivorans]|uniref:MarR family transcriptional regulator n=1 Tax=Desulfoplanes formicivorans TaxID=1592317 RepID=A0A194AEL5_9BACT|nr:MarR family EPS-associated transcriptional regulator [Desulfoplanes formicivorans]GAU07635.1 MarR family transcriptional regulator [Desulfoplanes formicivorans]
MNDATNYKIYKILEANPEISQRELARKLDVSLGKANYCLKGLVEKGLIKVSRFSNAKNKLVYLYLLTPKGIEHKAKVTLRYLKRRMQEYDELKEEIARLREEVACEPGEIRKKD